MRAHRSLALTSIAAALLTLGACAAEGTLASNAPVADAGVEAAPPAHDADVGAEASADAAIELPCSAAGWCATSVPDPQMTFFDIAPLETKAFALAWLHERTTLLAFDGQAWSALEHESWTNAPKGTQVLRALFAESESVVWVGGVGGLLLRGFEEGGTWSWSRHDLAGDVTVRSIWGAPSGDLYVVGEQRVYRRAPGAASFETDYEDTEVLDTIAPGFDDVLGTSADDVWVTGRRGGCGYAAHKTAAGWLKLVDARSFFVNEGCRVRSPFPKLDAPLIRPLAPSAHQLIAVSTTTLGGGLSRALVRVTHESDGGVLLETSPVFADVTAAWVNPGSPEAFIAAFGIVQRNPDPWQAGGNWDYSTTAMNDRPTLKWFYEIRGTRPDNMWVVGQSHALHKTTP